MNSIAPNKGTSTVQPAPLRKAQGVGPSVDVLGSRTPSFGASVNTTLEPSPLLKAPGVGPKIDVPGYRKPSFGASVKTLSGQAPAKKHTSPPGRGQAIDITA